MNRWLRYFYIIYLFCLFIFIFTVSLFLTGLLISKDAWADTGYLWSNGHSNTYYNSCAAACSAIGNPFSKQNGDHGTCYATQEHMDKNWATAVCAKVSKTCEKKSGGETTLYPPDGKNAMNWYPDQFTFCENNCSVSYKLEVVTELSAVVSMTHTGKVCGMPPPPKEGEEPKPPKADDEDDDKSEEPGNSGNPDDKWDPDNWERCPSGKGAYRKGTEMTAECAGNDPHGPNPDKPKDPKNPDDKGKGQDGGKGDSGGNSAGGNGSGGNGSGGNGSGGSGSGGSGSGGSGSGGSGSDGSGSGSGDGKGSVKGGSCKSNKPPTCKGDAVQCYIAREQWRTSCLAESGRTDLAAKGDCKTGKKPVCHGDATTCYQLQLQFEQTCAVVGPDPDFAGAKQGFGGKVGEDEVKDAIGLGNAPSKDDIKNTFSKEIDVSSFANRLNDRGFLGGKACMTSQQYTVGGITFTIDWSYLCLFLKYVGYFIVACGYFIGFRIVSGGFD